MTPRALSRPPPRALVELVRAPAALSVPGDTLVGTTAAARPLDARTPVLAASSVCLYWAGMALNDYADRRVDAAERPHRPIPSGRVGARFALGLAGGLTATGLGAAALAGGRRALAVAVPLAGTVWSYDLALKRTPAGPTAMAAARSLDVLLGASGGASGNVRAAAPASLTLGAHTLAVTTLSRSEVTGSQPRLPGATLAATAGVAGATACLAARGSRRASRLAAAFVPLSVYAASAGGAQFDAVRDPSPSRLQRAVGAGILGMMPLQSALTAAGGPRGYGPAAAVLAAFPLARKLSKGVSPT